MNDGLYILGSGKSQAHHRFSAGIAIRLEHRQLWIDPGVGAIVRASQIEMDPALTNYIIITHPSFVRCNDINAIADLIRQSGKKCTLIACDSLINKQGLLTEEARQAFERIITMRPEQEIAIDDVTFTAIALKSDDETAFGLHLDIAGLRICYTSDTEYHDGLAKESLCDIGIFNVMTYGSKYAKFGLNTDDVIKIGKAWHPKLVILSSFPKDYDRNPLYEAREVNQSLNTQCVAANDGLFVDLGLYLKAKQTTLGKF